MNPNSPQPPLFDATTSLTTVLAWSGLPEVLRRALTRSVPSETLARVSFLESLRSSDLCFREWMVGLLALDIGVDLEDRRDSLIGVFSGATLRTAEMTRFCIHGVGPRQGYGASFRSPSPTAAATVCAAAYVYVGDNGLLESVFVFVAGASREPVRQLRLPELIEVTLDEAHIERARGSVAKPLVLDDIGQATAVVREALLECRRATAPRDREEQGVRS